MPLITSLGANTILVMSLTSYVVEDGMVMMIVVLTSCCLRQARIDPVDCSLDTCNAGPSRRLRLLLQAFSSLQPDTVLRYDSGDIAGPDIDP